MEKTVYDTFPFGNAFYVIKEKEYEKVSIINVGIEDNKVYLILAGSLSNNTDVKYFTDEILDYYNKGIIYFSEEAVKKALEK